MSIFLHVELASVRRESERVNQRCPVEEKAKVSGRELIAFRGE